MNYFLSSTSAGSGNKGNVILDSKGKEITVEKFKELHAAGKVTNMNLSLQRLIEFNYDFEKLNEFYKNN